MSATAVESFPTSNLDSLLLAKIPHEKSSKDSLHAQTQYRKLQIMDTEMQAIYQEKQLHEVVKSELRKISNI